MAINLGKLTIDTPVDIANRIGGTGYNPNPTNIADTRIGEVDNYTSDGQREQATHAVTKNNSKSMAHQLQKELAPSDNKGSGNAEVTPSISNTETAQPSMLNAVGNVYGQLYDSEGNLKSSAPKEEKTEGTPASNLLEQLNEKNEKAYQDYINSKRSNAINRIGFALGQLAGGTRKSGLSTVYDDKDDSELAKMYTDINKKNQDWYNNAIKLQNQQSLEKQRQANIDRIERDSDRKDQQWLQTAQMNDLKSEYLRMQTRVKEQELAIKETTDEALKQKMETDLAKNKAYIKTLEARASKIKTDEENSIERTQQYKDESDSRIDKNNSQTDLYKDKKDNPDRYKSSKGTAGGVVFGSDGKPVTSGTKKSVSGFGTANNGGKKKIKGFGK